MTPQDLLRAAQEVADRTPDARLVKNEVGNLAIMDAEMGFVGWIDLRYGEVDYLDGPWLQS